MQEKLAVLRYKTTENGVYLKNDCLRTQVGVFCMNHIKMGNTKMSQKFCNILVM